MNVLIVSTSDIHGGAAIAAFRLMRALQTVGTNVKMIVREKQSDDKDIIQVGGNLNNKWNFYWERGIIFLKNRLSKENLFDISIANTGISITKLPEFQQADVIHLHWINQGMLAVNEIKDILKSGKKVVWTMHDMWAFTGICHHARKCIGFQNSCGNCPYLKTNTKKDLSHRIFEEKMDAYSYGKISFVACSKWLKSLAVTSPLTKNHLVTAIPNPIDTNMYSNSDKTEIRRKLHLPLDKKIVLFAAVKASDKRKGVDFLLDTAKQLSAHKNQLLFLIVGNEGDQIAQQIDISTFCTGFIDPKQMQDLYNAADLFLTPSLQENLPNTIMEAMACGTPCVGFNIGGIPEMIDHKKNGYVAEYMDANDLTRGILWSLFESDAEMLSKNAREKVLLEYEQDKIAKRYLKLYEQ
ncbi:MAG: glycosyltransferase family 4 protein [Dysgonamonadaceae bacterium]